MAMTGTACGGAIAMEANAIEMENTEIELEKNKGKKMGGPFAEPSFLP
jgi:hypothetical protein